MEEYPIIIDGVQSGKLNKYEDGLFTVFEANCDMRPEIVRLSVYGQGKEGYLGVMLPNNDCMYLKRRLSAGDMRLFPEKIECAGLSGLDMTVPQAEEKEAVAEAPAPPIEEAVDPAGETSDDLLWFSTPEGFLTAFDGRRSLIAMPAEGRGGPKEIRRIINGREYAVFPGKSVNK